MLTAYQGKFQRNWEISPVSHTCRSQFWSFGYHFCISLPFLGWFSGDQIPCDRGEVVKSSNRMGNWASTTFSHFICFNLSLETEVAGCMFFCPSLVESLHSVFSLSFKICLLKSVMGILFFSFSNLNGDF